MGGNKVDLLSTAEHLPDLARGNFTVALAAPVAALPTVEEIDDMEAKRPLAFEVAQSTARMRYFASLFILSYAVTVLLGTCIMTLGPRCCGSPDGGRLSEFVPLEQAEYQRKSDDRMRPWLLQLARNLGMFYVEQRVVSLAFTAVFCTSLAAAVFSLATDRLSKRFGRLLGHEQIPTKLEQLLQMDFHIFKPDMAKSFVVEMTGSGWMIGFRWVGGLRLGILAMAGPSPVGSPVAPPEVAPWFARKLRQALAQRDAALEQRLRRDAFGDAATFSAVAPLLRGCEELTELRLDFTEGLGNSKQKVEAEIITTKARLHGGACGPSADGQKLQIITTKAGASH
eukprot:Skav202784  [mRNA]  locus=scaffold326:508338:513246:+ [translate_table: standard]